MMSRRMAYAHKKKNVSFAKNDGFPDDFGLRNAACASYKKKRQKKCY